MRRKAVLLNKVWHVAYMLAECLVNTSYYKKLGIQVTD